MIPVLVLNPSSKHTMKHRRRRHSPRRHRAPRRRNPSIAWAALGVAALAGAAIGGIRYASDMTTASANVLDGATVAVGLVGGAALSMVSPAAGAAVIGAGVGLGTAGLMRTNIAQPAKAKTMGMVIDSQQLGAIVDGRVRAALQAASPGMNGSARQRVYSRAA